MSREFLLIGLISVLVRLPWVFMVPTGEAPDEYTHMWMIAFIRDHWQLPGSADMASAGPYGVYGSLPAIGYLPHVLVTAILGNNILYARLASLLMGLLSIWAASLAGRELFPESRLLALALPLMMAFHPQLVFVHSYANNDATAMALSSLVVYCLIVILKNGLNIRRLLAIALLMSWLVLSKYSGAAILPAVVLALAAAGFLHGMAAWSVLCCLFAFAAIVLAGSGWCFLRNYHEFGGDWLGTKTMYRIWATAFHRQLVYRLEPWQVLSDRRWWRFMFFSFWGMFGYANRYLWRPLYFVYLAFQIASLIGWLKKGRQGRAQMVRPAVWLMLLSVCLFNLIGMVYASTVNLGGPQGRYLLVSELPVMALLLAGLSRLGPRLGRYAVLALLAYNALACLVSWSILFGIYTRAPG